MRAFVFAAGVAALVAGGAVAQTPDTTPDNAVEHRQQLMKEISQNQKAIGAWIAGNNVETAATVMEHGYKIESLAAKIPEMFEEQIYSGDASGIETRATAEIWQRWDEFAASAERLEERAAALASAASGGDIAAVETAYKNMTQTCGECHNGFRIKKD